MGKVNLFLDLETVPLPDRGRRGRPLAHAVHREHDGLSERRREERTRRMAEMVLAEEQLLVPDPVASDFAELFEQQVLEEKLLPQPQGDRHTEGPEPARREGQVGLEQALELEEGLVVEDDAVNTAQPEPGLAHAVADRVSGKPGIVLLAREALFLRRSDDMAVFDQRGRAVVVERRDSEDAQVPPPQNSV